MSWGGAGRERLLCRGPLSAFLCCRVDSGSEVVNGFKRLRAARARGGAELVAQVTPADAAAAKLRLWQANRASGIELSWVIRALYREADFTQPQIAVLDGRD